MPEVETIRRYLCDKVEGRRIQDIDILLDRLVKWPSPEEFRALLIGKTISRLRRRGKYLLFEISDGNVLVVHLRMTGRLYYAGQGHEEHFARIIFRLDNGDRLVYADSRTLGTLYLMPQDQLQRIAGLAQMGPEPLTKDFTPAYFRKALTGRKARIKGLLLDQGVVGGLGNIYVDEALALAGINPERSATSLDHEEIARLYDAVNTVIAAGIEHGGTTFRDYRNGRGEAGEHQHYLRVYGKEDTPCPNCGAIIVWKKVGGRGTHYCPNCQK